MSLSMLCAHTLSLNERVQHFDMILFKTIDVSCVKTDDCGHKNHTACKTPFALVFFSIKK